LGQSPGPLFVAPQRELIITICARTGSELLDDGGEPPTLMEYRALVEEIDDRCRALHREIPADWADRACSEITMAGDQPNHRRGDQQQTAR
jgi:hypothetical protein